MAFTVIAGSLTILYAHKLFGLVTWMPDNCMRWIGQQVQNLGEQSDVQQAQGHFYGAAGLVYNTGRGAKGQFAQNTQKAAQRDLAQGKGGDDSGGGNDGGSTPDGSSDGGKGSGDGGKKAGGQNDLAQGQQV